MADVTPLEDEVGDETRAERLAASAIRRFVRYLELMRAREGETSEVLDIRVELDSVAADDSGPETSSSRTRPSTDRRRRRPDGAGRRHRGRRAPDDRDPPTRRGATSSSRTTRRSCPTCCPGIVQVELPRRQALLEAATTTERLEALVRLLDRELLLLGRRLRLFAPDPRQLLGPRRS